MSKTQSLESQLYFVALQRLLETQPERAAELAMNILGDYLEQARLNAALHKENERLNERLQRQQRSPQLFPLPKERERKEVMYKTIQCT